MFDEYNNFSGQWSSTRRYRNDDENRRFANHFAMIIFRYVLLSSKNQNKKSKSQLKENAQNWNGEFQI